MNFDIAKPSQNAEEWMWDRKYSQSLKKRKLNSHDKCLSIQNKNVSALRPFIIDAQKQFGIVVNREIMQINPTDWRWIMPKKEIHGLILCKVPEKNK